MGGDQKEAKDNENSGEGTETGFFDAQNSNFYLPRREIRTSILKIIMPGRENRSLIGVDMLPAVTEMPGSMRIMQLNYAVQLQERILKALDSSNKIRRLGALPTVRSVQDRFGITRVIVKDPLAAAEVIAQMENEHLPLKVFLSAESAPILKVNGCASPLSMEYVEDPRALAKTFTDLPKVSLIEDIKPWENIPGLDDNANVNKPRLGLCTYLVVDVNIFNAGDCREILDHLAVISQSKDYCINFDQAGNVVILALHERAASMLLIWGSELRKITRGRGNLMLGKGEIKTADSDSLVVDNYMNHAGSYCFQKLGTVTPDFYSTSYYVNQIAGSRDETLARIAPRGKVMMGFLPIEVQERVEYSVGGGPDRLIGLKQEYQDLKTFLNPNDPAKLILLEGMAGIGKSRLSDEVIRDLANAVKISINPGGRSSPGASLIDVADQLCQFIAAVFRKTGLPHRLKALMDFQQKNRNVKLLDANGEPEKVCGLCLDALLCLEEERGNLQLFIDDIHHNDRHSDGLIMDLVKDFLLKRSAASKVVMMRRPEERYASLAQDSLKKEIEETTVVSLHDLNGKPKLNFEDKQTCNDYVYYSLPPEMRINPENGKKRQLGEWPQVLGKMSKTAFDMTSYIQEILDHASEYLLMERDRIDLNQKGLDKMKQAQGKEMVIYHLERIREQLSADSLKMLQAFAIVGFKFAFREYLQKFMELAFGFPAEKTDDLLRELKDKGYLVSKKNFFINEESGAEDPLATYRIWHENLQEIVLNHTMDGRQREEMATGIYRAAAESGLVSDDQQFQIMHFAARNKNPGDSVFWADYRKYAKRTLDAARSANAYARGFSVATMILDSLEGEDHLQAEGMSTMVRALNDLSYGEKMDGETGKFILDSLGAIVFNGYYQGEMDQVYSAIGFAERIQEHFPDWDTGLVEFYEIGFDAAYFQSNKEKLIYFYNILQKFELGEEKKRLYTLRMLYRRRMLPECRKILQQYRREKEMPPEVRRLKYRIELQDIVRELMKGGVDGDVVNAGFELNDEQKEKAKKVDRGIRNFRKQFFAGSNAPEQWAGKRNHPIMELTLLDIEGDAAAYLDNYDHAIKCYAEMWRLSMQMYIPMGAAFAAKRKGDAEIMKAVLAEQEGRPLKEQQKLLNKAIYTYTEEGLNVVKKFADKQWTFDLAIQRLRAICMKLATYAESGLPGADAEKLVGMGLEDMAALNLPQFTQDLPTEGDSGFPEDDLANCYYITPYVSQFRTLCRELSYGLRLQEEPYAFETPACISGAWKYGKRFHDDKMGEKERKMKALKSSAFFFWTVNR